jgi:hypothetical protein
MAIVQYTSESTYPVSGKYEYVDIIKEFAHGCVINVGSRSAQIMSDVWDTEYYAEYWDEKSQSVKNAYLYLACESRGWDRNSTAEVDATPEVWAKVEQFYFEREYAALERQAQKEAQTIRKDSIVKITGGRQNKGEEGKVVIVIERPYGMGYRSVMMEKYGIATSDVMVDKMVNGRIFKNYRDIVWAWARNCELMIVPEIDTATITKSAKFRAKSKVQDLQKNGLKRSYNKAA